MSNKRLQQVVTNNWVHPTMHYIRFFWIFLFFTFIFEFQLFCHNTSVFVVFSIPLTTILFKFVLLVQWVLIIILYEYAYAHTHTQTHRIIYLYCFCCHSVVFRFILYLSTCDLFHMGLNECMLKLNEKQYWTERYCAMCVCSALDGRFSAVFCNSFFLSSLVGISLKCDAFLYPLFSLFFFCLRHALFISSGNESSSENNKHSHGRSSCRRKSLMKF